MSFYPPVCVISLRYTYVSLSLENLFHNPSCTFYIPELNISLLSADVGAFSPILVKAKERLKLH